MARAMIDSDEHYEPLRLLRVTAAVTLVVLLAMTVALGRHAHPLLIVVWLVAGVPSGVLGVTVAAERAALSLQHGLQQRTPDVASEV
jgi:hypothetical protein